MNLVVNLKSISQTSLADCKETKKKSYFNIERLSKNLLIDQSSEWDEMSQQMGTAGVGRKLQTIRESR